MGRKTIPPSGGFCYNINMKKENEDYKKLEAKFDALCHYLKVDVVAEKDSEKYYHTVVQKYDGSGWESIKSRFF
jgi:hypothetical protein